MSVNDNIKRSILSTVFARYFFLNSLEKMLPLLVFVVVTPFAEVPSCLGFALVLDETSVRAAAVFADLGSTALLACFCAGVDLGAATGVCFCAAVEALAALGFAAADDFCELAAGSGVLRAVLALACTADFAAVFGFSVSVGGMPADVRASAVFLGAAGGGAAVATDTALRGARGL